MQVSKIIKRTKMLVKKCHSSKQNVIWLLIMNQPKIYGTLQGI